MIHRNHRNQYYNLSAQSNIKLSPSTKTTTNPLDKALISITNVENLQNEVWRLRQILEDYGIPHSDENNVCSYVCHVLNVRFRQIINKERSNWFTKHYKKQFDCIDGEYTIVSAHGREGEVQQQPRHIASALQEGPSIIYTSDDAENSLFPSNLLSLDMVFTQEMYDLALREIEQKQINELSDHHSMYEREKLFIPQLFFRAVQLGLNFTPVTLTIGLAALSKNFRDKVWYNLVGRCLAKSGPAFIKWGKYIVHS